MSSTQFACSRCGALLDCDSATQTCPSCGQPMAAAAPVTNNARVLAVGGLAFAALALVLLAGISVVLWIVFAREPAAIAAAPAVHEAIDESQTPPVRPDAPTGVVPPPGATVMPVAAGDPDVADVAKPALGIPVAPVAPLAVRGPPAIAPAIAPPIVKVQIVQNRVPGVEQPLINAAIDGGVSYLKRSQLPRTGTWGANRQVGYTALAGLTLLECNVPPSDAHVNKAARYIRTQAPNLFTTYELSLAILFLDRLGNPADKSIIQGMALRLMAGQNHNGGWTYVDQPVLTSREMKQFLTFLKSHRPPVPLAKVIHMPAGLDRQLGAPNAGLPGKQLKGGPEDDLFKQFADPMPPAAESDSAPKVNRPVAESPRRPAPDEKPHKAAPAKKAAPMAIARLPVRLQQLPVVQLNVAKGNFPPNRFLHHGDDNSNTQFALMGLWAARRHDVPTEFSLRLAEERFVNTQHKNDGGWGYHINMPTKDTMTCVGLIGLAMGHGVHADVVGKAQPADPAINLGLTTLGGYIGVPSGDPNARIPMQNLYFLWSVERVAMLYNLKTIGGKDWYGWGAQSLLKNQWPNGSWTNGGYHAANDHCDTCFALLFLKRSNLVPDLTEHLQLRMVIRDPYGK